MALIFFTMLKLKLNFSDWVYIFNWSVVYILTLAIYKTGQTSSVVRRGLPLILSAYVCTLGGSWTLYAEDNDLSHFVVIIMDMLVQAP